jgi:hypothetical protein
LFGPNLKNAAIRLVKNFRVGLSDEKTFQSYSNGRVRDYRLVGERFSEQYVHKIKRSGRFSVNV